MENNWNIFKLHRLVRQKYRYPELAGLISRTFVEMLEQKGIVGRESLEREAFERMKSDGLPDTEDNRRQYTEALTDAYAANSFSPDEIENYINLARKRDRAQTLTAVSNREQATTMEVIRALREFAEIPMGEVYMAKEEVEGIRVALLSRFFTNQLPFIKIAKNHITIRDIDTVLQRTLFSRKEPGKLGGKAAGIILAYRILLPLLEKHDPELETYLHAPDTWYLSSGIFSEFVDRNGLYFFHAFKYKDRAEIENQFERIEERFRDASFAPDTVEDFRMVLEEIGDHPIIVRSSSLLEDNFGLAFSGKYLSLFLANQGDLESRLDRFILALKKVFASTFGPDPILYRRDHGLLDYDERMAMIVQKVVGRRVGDSFYPLAAGVMFSKNFYAWTPRIRRDEGLVRLVFGLGTRAVDRVGSDYPRMVPLSHPVLRPEVTAEQIRKYSQKQVDVVNLTTGGLDTVDFGEMCVKAPHPDLFYAVSVEREGHLAAPHFKGQDITGGAPVITFDNLLTKTPFVKLAKKILSRLEGAYGRPIDSEFAWEGNIFYVLQCRSLSTRSEPEGVKVPEDIAPERTLFTTHYRLFSSIVKDLEYIVYADPRAYDVLGTYQERLEIASVIKLLNKLLGETRFALIGPGRWGSNDINLGIKVTYAGINRAKLLVEVAFAKEGYTPEVSYGTHFFEDLVEADIAIVALFPDDPATNFNEAFLLRSENRLGRLAPDLKHWESVVRVIHVPSASGGLLLQVLLDGKGQKGIGFFGTSELKA
jgi:hypothetical protein